MFTKFKISDSQSQTSNPSSSLLSWYRLLTEGLVQCVPAILGLYVDSVRLPAPLPAGAEHEEVCHHGTHSGIRHQRAGIGVEELLKSQILNKLDIGMASCGLYASGVHKFLELSQVLEVHVGEFLVDGDLHLGAGAKGFASRLHLLNGI